MASIKLKHASGNSTILNSPAANPSSDITLKLPSTSGSAGQVLKVASANHSATNAELEFAADAGGKILQMQHFRKGDHASSTITGSASGSGDWNYTGFQPAITPTASTSKILMTGHISVGGDQCLIYIEILVNGSYSTGGPQGDANGSRRSIHSSADHVSDRGGNSIPINYVFTPGTTATQTYNFRFNHESSSNKTLYINRSTHTDNNQRQGDGLTHITLIEFAPN